LKNYIEQITYFSQSILLNSI